MSKMYTLKLTAAVVLAGKIVKPPQEVEVDHATAKSLLHRGKAVIVGDERLDDDADVAQATDSTDPGASSAAKIDEGLAPAEGDKKSGRKAAKQAPQA